MKKENKELKFSILNKLFTKRKSKEKIKSLSVNYSKSIMRKF